VNFLVLLKVEFYKIYFVYVKECRSDFDGQVILDEALQQLCQWGFIR